jgi:hypothetical protein
MKKVANRKNRNKAEIKAIQSVASYDKMSTLKRSKNGLVIPNEKSLSFAWSESEYARYS